MRTTAKRYTDDFKQMIIEVYKTGKPIKEICEEYGVSHSTVNNWTKSIQPKKISKKPIVSTKKSKEKANLEMNRENKQLKKEIERIIMDNEILKKAIAIFSKDQEI